MHARILAIKEELEDLKRAQREAQNGFMFAKARLDLIKDQIRKLRAVLDAKEEPNDLRPECPMA